MISFNRISTARAFGEKLFNINHDHNFDRWCETLAKQCPKPPMGLRSSLSYLVATEQPSPERQLLYVCFFHFSVDSQVSHHCAHTQSQNITATRTYLSICLSMSIYRFVCLYIYICIYPSTYAEILICPKTCIGQ